MNSILFFCALQNSYFAVDTTFDSPRETLQMDTERTSRLSLSEALPKINHSPLPLRVQSQDDTIQARDTYFGYRKVCKVGEGCSAIVWRAENFRGDTIAVKQLKSNAALNEAELLRDVKEDMVSNYLIKPFEAFGGVGDHRCRAELLAGEFATEFLEGKNLIEVFAEFGDDDVVCGAKLWAMGHVLCAVAEMVDREEPFIHNDLHSRNVMIVVKNDALEVKIVDLEIAGFVDDPYCIEMLKYNESEKLWEDTEVEDTEGDCLRSASEFHWLTQVDLIPDDVFQLMKTFLGESCSPEILQAAKGKKTAGLNNDEVAFLRGRLKNMSAYEKKRMLIF